MMKSYDLVGLGEFSGWCGSNRRSWCQIIPFNSVVTFVFKKYIIWILEISKYAFPHLFLIDIPINDSAIDVIVRYDII